MSVLHETTKELFFLCLPLFYYRGISSTPELLEPVLRPRTALYCGDELMGEQQQQQQQQQDEYITLQPSHIHSYDAAYCRACGIRRLVYAVTFRICNRRVYPPQCILANISSVLPRLAFQAPPSSIAALHPFITSLSRNMYLTMLPNKFAPNARAVFRGLRSF